MHSNNMPGAMPSPTAPVKQHEAFLEETKSLLHPGNFQVALIVHNLRAGDVYQNFFVISIIFGHLLTRRKMTHYIYLVSLLYKYKRRW